MSKPKGVAVMHISIKPKGESDSPVDDDPGDEYDGSQGHEEGMKQAMKLIQQLMGGGDEDA